MVVEFNIDEHIYRLEDGKLTINNVEWPVEDSPEIVVLVQEHANTLDAVAKLTQQYEGILQQVNEMIEEVEMDNPLDRIT